ncbi:MAG: carbohydrate-binding protein [bacterium]|nr:carbohydrate-binding protein [bacterium]
MKATTAFRFAVALSLASSGVHSGAAAGSGRGRVTLSGGTIVTDRGTLLRGARVSTDATERLPRRSDVTYVKQCGLNSIHLYAESFVRHSPGQLHALVDSLVAWTRRDSLYLVLTIGCLDRNGFHDYDFTMNFWRYYAPRYADETHVVYEIHNEPHAWEPPYPDSTLAMERDAYAVIRSHAPETHVLFFSYACPSNSAGMLRDIGKLGTGIDWSNASVGTHGYNVSYSTLESVMNDVRSAGYGITNTEPCYVQITDPATVAQFRTQVRVFEWNGISYLNFHSIEELRQPARFKSLIATAGLSWTPDFGTWPPPVRWNPYADMEAEYFSDQGGPSGVVDLETRVGFVSNGDWIRFRSVDFGSGASRFGIRAASGGIGGSVEIRLDSTDGFLAGRVSIAPTGGWDVWTEKSCGVTGASGSRDLVLKFTGGEYDLFDVDRFRFTPAGTGVRPEDRESPSPEDCGLCRNYPNPFNASTVIGFRVARPGPAVLDVLDTNGRLMETLFAGHADAGPHTAVWTADGMASGVYVCRLRAGDFTDAVKIILQR